MAYVQKQGITMENFQKQGITMVNAQKQGNTKSTKPCWFVLARSVNQTLFLKLKCTSSSTSLLQICRPSFTASRSVFLFLVNFILCRTSLHSLQLEREQNIMYCAVDYDLSQNMHTKGHLMGKQEWKWRTSFHSDESAAQRKGHTNTFHMPQFH